MSGFANLFLGGMVVTAAATQIPKAADHADGFIKDHREAHETLPKAEQALSSIGNCYMEITTDKYTYKVKGIVAPKGNQLQISFKNSKAEFTFDFRTKSIKAIEPIYRTEKTRVIEQEITPNRKRQTNSYESDLFWVMQQIQNCIPTKQEAPLDSMIHSVTFEQ